MLPEFRNEPFTDFSRPENEAAFRAALNAIKVTLGKTYPLVINGKSITIADTFPSINPSRPAEVVGHFANGNANHADAAVEAAWDAFQTWQYVPVAERVRYLLRAAAEMRRRKHEFSAVMVLETGKSWMEADADTAESIDFLEYYARQALRLFDQSDMLAPYPPEHLGLYNLPLGVGAIIPPWNFPNAIPMGLVAAALVAAAAQNGWVWHHHFFAAPHHEHHCSIPLTLFLTVAAALLTALAIIAPLAVAAPPRSVTADRDRSPVDVALSPNGKWLLTAAHYSPDIDLEKLKSGNPAVAVDHPRDGLVGDAGPVGHVTDRRSFHFGLRSASDGGGRLTAPRGGHMLPVTRRKASRFGFGSAGGGRQRRPSARRREGGVAGAGRSRA